MVSLFENEHLKRFYSTKSGNTLFAIYDYVIRPQFTENV